MTKPCVLFVSWHFYLDSSNGASISARELLVALSEKGWKVHALCGPLVDNPEVSDVFSTLASYRFKADLVFREERISPFTVYSFKENASNILSGVFVPDDSSRVPKRATGELFLRFLTRSIEEIKPDIVVTYGGGWMASETLRIARRYGAKTVFLLQNFAYHDAKLFSDCDLTIVPSRYAADVYKKRLGIETIPIPPLMKRNRIVFQEPGETVGQKYVLYVNPSPEKGVFLFVKIVQEMLKRRSDIQFLVVEGSSTSKALFLSGADVDSLKNIRVMSNTTCPGCFYQKARITIVPSLCEETFGRVVAESSIAGIPVIVTDCGALSETIDNSGRVIHVEEMYSLDTTKHIFSNEVQPWIDEIIRLWDDSNYYAKRVEQCLKNARRWDYDFVLSKYAEALTQVLRY